MWMRTHKIVLCKKDTTAERKIAFLSIQTFKNGDIKNMKEPLFISQVVEKLLCSFLTDGFHIFLQGSTDESIGSKERRGKVGRIPDLSVLVKMDNNTAMPFICEVKSPNYMKHMQMNSCQISDFVKLCNILKDELDHMGNIDDKVVYGLLVEGCSAELYCMDLNYVL